MHEFNVGPLGRGRRARCGDGATAGVRRGASLGLTAALVVTGALSTTGPAGATGDDDYVSQAGGVPGTPEPGDLLGSAVAIGDFNGDGYDDAAIGAPGEAIGPRAGAGAVNVLYGTGVGLTNYASQFWSQDSTGVPGGSETGDRFGAALAAGDFNDDGRDELAIGVPGEAIGSIPQAGMVNILVGTNSGLTGSPLTIHQNRPGVDGACEPGDQFGSSLATGGIGGREDDLFVGVPHEDLGTRSDAGMAHFIPGFPGEGPEYPGGLSLPEEFAFHQDSWGVPTAARANEQFGASFAVADFTGDARGDVAVSAPREAVDGGEGYGPNGGVVFMIPGDVDRPVLGEGIVKTDGIDQLSDATDRYFGQDLAVRMRKSSPTSDLVVGVRDSIQGPGGGAEVFRYDGDPSGEGLTPIIGHPSSADPGRAVAGRAQGFYSNESSGVLVGIPELTEGGAARAGAVDGWPGVFGQVQSPGSSETDDRFGHDLAIGDLDGDGIDDLLIGVPGEDIGTVADAGGAVVGYGANLPDPFS